MNRFASRLSSEKIDRKRLKKACNHIFGYLDKESFNIKETKALYESIGHIIGKIEECDRLETQIKEIGSCDYSSCIDDTLSFVAASKTESL